MSFITEPLNQLPMIDKDPDVNLDYSYSFTDFLAEMSDTIATAEVVSESTNCTISGVAHSNGVVSCLIAGGEHGRIEPIKFRIVTVGGKTADSTILLNIKPS